MKLADLRKLAIRRQSEIRFSLGNGMECVVDRHGVARVPALRGVPDFNLESELASAREFLIEPAASAKTPSRPQAVSREELAAMTAASPASAPSAHEEE
jgi:hypothetical protein